MKNYNLKNLIALSTLFVLIAATSHALQYERYELTIIDTLGGNFSAASDLNDSGQVVGSSYTEDGFPYSHAFLWENGEMTDLGLLPEDDTSSARSINNSGTVLIVGISGTVGSGSYDAVLWEDGIPTALGVYGWAEDINDNGQIVGGYLNDQAWLWENGNITDLGSLVEGQESVATSINNIGQVVGYANIALPGTSNRLNAFIWEDGEMKPLENLPGPTDNAPHTQATDINDIGQVVGRAANRVFLWENGNVTWLTLESGSAADINNKGQVVGSFNSEDYEHVFLWDSTNGLEDLNDLIPVESDWILYGAAAINENGQMVGSAVRDLDGDGQWEERHGFLLTPKSEYLAVTSLNGGEELNAGDIFVITWATGGNVDFVKIEYSNNNGADWIEIVGSSGNSGFYIWEVPIDYSNECLLRISSVNGDSSDESDSVFSIYPPSYIPPTLYVDGDIAASGNGISWGEAFKTIQEAIDAAETYNEIWVRKGTYFLTSAIRVEKKVSLRGGFEGTETELNQRDWQNNVTTVDGQDLVNCFTVDADATIDGFFITKGKGAYVDWDHIGGGIYHVSSSLIVANCNFFKNLQAEHGGAIYSESDNSLFITGCDFTDNQAEHLGGAIYSEGSNFFVTDCIFLDNITFEGRGSAIYGDSVTITGCTFDSNWAEDGAGAIDVSTGNISNCVFVSNTSVWSSGAISANGPLLIANCKFTNNLSYYGGGGAVSVGGQTKITNCLFSMNAFSNSRDGDQYSGGGAIDIYNSASVITNCTFHGNRAMDPYGESPPLAGAIFNFGDAGPTIINSIFWENVSPDGTQIGGGIPIVSYSNIDQDGYEGIDGNIRQDPLFVSPDFGDYNLQTGSLCINSGDNSADELPLFDLDGKPRIIDGIVDMGAYEHPPYCKADFNDDGNVDDIDLNIFSIAMGETNCTWWPALCDCDTEGDDNDIDGADLAILAAEFGRSDCP